MYGPAYEASIAIIATTPREARTNSSVQLLKSPRKIGLAITVDSGINCDRYAECPGGKQVVT